MVAIPARSVVEALAKEIEAGRLDPTQQIQSATRDWDPDAVLALVLACRAAGRTVPTSAAAELIPHLSNPLVLPLVVGGCEGDRASMLLDVVESNRMGSDLDAVSLFLAHHMAEGGPPARLLSLVRAVGRKRLGVESSILVALLARRLGDPNVLAVRGRRRSPGSAWAPALGPRMGCVGANDRCGPSARSRGLEEAGRVQPRG